MKEFNGERTCGTATAFPLLASPGGREQLRQYYTAFARIALEKGLGFFLETPTWRASSDWGTLLGYDEEKLAAANADAVQLMVEVRRAGSGGV